MTIEERVRRIARNLIYSYCAYVRNKIAASDENYLKSEIDSDIVKYELLFTDAVQLALGVDRDLSEEFPLSLVRDAAVSMKPVIDDKKNAYALSKYAGGICDTCMLIFRRVEEGIRKNGG